MRSLAPATWLRGRGGLGDARPRGEERRPGGAGPQALLQELAAVTGHSVLLGPARAGRARRVPRIRPSRARELDRAVDLEREAAAAAVGTSRTSGHFCSSRWRSRISRLSRLSLNGGRPSDGSRRSSRLENAVRPSRCWPSSFHRMRPGHVADQVLAVDEHAVVVAVEARSCGGALASPARRARAASARPRRRPGGLVAARLEHPLDPERDLVADDLEVGLVPLVERHRLAALGREHADEAVAHGERDHERALGVGQPGQRDLGRERARALRPRARSRRTARP